MTDEYKDILETMEALSNREDWKQTLNTINIISNLLWEVGNTRKTSAVYTRTLKHGSLTLTIDYRD